MRKDQLWSRRAQAGFKGYSALYPAAIEPRRQGPVAPARGQLPTEALVSAPMRSGRAKAKADAAARQRLVLTVLFTALVLPALTALATGSTAAWWVVLAVLPFVCAYLAVLFRARRLQAEKEFNTAFLGGARLSAAGLEDIFSARPELRGSHLRDQRQQVAASR